MDDPLTPNPYKTLNVPKDATLATIRSAHRKLVLLCHPDKVQEETAKKIKAEQFHLVQQAYEILSDETRRRRYDARLKLAELREERADMMDDRPPARRSSEYSPKTTQSPAFSEMRNGREYVEVKPRSTRYEDEGDVFSQRFAGERVKRFDERKYDDRYREPLPRKTSGRPPEEKKKYRDWEQEEIDRARSERRAKEMKAQQDAFLREQARKRDKETKRDRETKSSEKFRPTTWTSEGEFESEPDRYFNGGRGDPKPNRGPGHIRRGSREEPPRRGSKVKEYDEPTSFDEKIYEAQTYITKSRGEVDSEPPRSRRSRTSSINDRPPPPAPSAPRNSDGMKKSSRRSPNERANSPPRKSNKDKRPSEVVEPSSSRKPSMPKGSTEPKGMNIKDFFSSSRKQQDSRKEPQRASTNYPQAPETKYTSTEPRKPGIRRAETMPINQTRRSEAMAPTPSHLRNSKAPSSDSSDLSSDTSDSDSDATPEITPAQHSTKYKVSTDATERPRIVPVTMASKKEQEEYRSSREPSPKTGRRSSERPGPVRGNTTYTPPTAKRATSYATDDRPLRPGKLHRSETDRPVQAKYKSSNASPLFGAIDSDDARSPRIYPGDGVRQSKPYGRRESEDYERDAYPYVKQPRRSEIHAS